MRAARETWLRSPWFWGGLLIVLLAILLAGADWLSLHPSFAAPCGAGLKGCPPLPVGGR